MHRLGIEAYTIGVPFFHYASGTLKHATEEERKRIEKRADLDRDAFKEKWHCLPGTTEYEALFTASTFGVDSHVTPMAKPHEVG
jgi:hypothetical protein